MVTAQTAVGFVIFASLMLMVLYFFLNHIFAIVLVSTRTLGMSRSSTACGWSAHPDHVPSVTHR